MTHLPDLPKYMPRLCNEQRTAICASRHIWTGLPTGGKMTRTLEFLMEKAEAQGADMVMTKARPSPSPDILDRVFEWLH